MWLPILSYADGYGFTYGARVSFVGALGPRSRLSMPFSWGADRRAALEVERTLDGPISVVRGAVSAGRRVNPHFEFSDYRVGARIGAERTMNDWLRVGVGARAERVEFGPAYQALHAAGSVQATVDTRIDPSFPRNAVHARLAWEHIAFEVGDASRWSADARGYIGLGGSAVLALLGQLTVAAAALPSAEQSLLGGSGSLRGYPTGYRAGDNLAAASVELRYPLNSPLRIGRFGLKAFVDTGTVWDNGQRLRDQAFERGVGGGVYLGAAAFVADFDVGWPEGGKPKVHFGLGVSF
jgi:outer membrane protein assembly factor BamA